jgi:hypothetical protein
MKPEKDGPLTNDETTIAKDKPKMNTQRFHYDLEYEHTLMNLLARRTGAVPARPVMSLS